MHRFEGRKMRKNMTSTSRYEEPRFLKENESGNYLELHGTIRKMSLKT